MSPYFAAATRFKADWFRSLKVHQRGRPLLVAFFLACSFAGLAIAQSIAHDPGPRAGTVDSGQPLASVAQDPAILEYFNDGLTRFNEVDEVANGLGPRFNSNSCGGCHAQPAAGGSSPSVNAFPNLGPNPQTLVFNLEGAHNSLPPFITPNGPVREARFKFFLSPNGSLSNNPDGGVHDLFVITGRSDAGSCNLAQPNFAHHLALNNIIFRIPTPVFGAGLMENIPDEAILANMNANPFAKRAVGISGHPNRSGNDGTITRFGWKAQNKSLEVFTGEAYNVEMGVTNELFMNERPNPDEAAGLPANCKLNPTPEDITNMAATQTVKVPSDSVAFSMFMRLLAPPAPSATVPGGANSINNGRGIFSAIGCALCHTPTLTTGASKLTPSLSNASANLYSDLLVHNMGNGLADGVSQGGAGNDEFRTAPLWGLGQRVFFLHDGRTSDLPQAIRAHASSGSEANSVISLFNRLSQQQQQDLLNFLRSL